MHYCLGMTSDRISHITFEQVWGEISDTHDTTFIKNCWHCPTHRYISLVGRCAICSSEIPGKTLTYE